MLDEKPFDGIRSLRLDMSVEKVDTIMVEMLPELVDLRCEDANIFIVVGDRKYRLMECVSECGHGGIELTSLLDPERGWIFDWNRFFTSKEEENGGAK
jgi:hypothetical protein